MEENKMSTGIDKEQCRELLLLKESSLDDLNIITKFNDCPIEISKIFEFLSINKNIKFRSQQIDDLDLKQSEKVVMAHDIYNRNPQLFLMRFGSFMEEKHLVWLKNLIISSAALPFAVDENPEEIQLLLANFNNKLQTQRQDIRNRRYAVLQQLIQQGDYFSEQEMMLRSPQLYHELVGQYLSKEEKTKRDSYDVQNTTFSGILMHAAHQQQLSDILEHVTREKCENAAEVNYPSYDYARKTTLYPFLQNINIEDNIHNSLDNSQYENDVPISLRQQWGNFDNEQISCSTSKNIYKSDSNFNLTRKNNTNVTAGERNLLRQEFISLMYVQFLEGNDDFDYTQVDDNPQLDDLKQINQDMEDKYFEKSDDENDNNCKRNDAWTMLETNNVFDAESEDELDVYMNHLSQFKS